MTGAEVRVSDALACFKAFWLANHFTSWRKGVTHCPGPAAGYFGPWGQLDHFMAILEITPNWLQHPFWFTGIVTWHLQDWSSCSETAVFRACFGTSRPSRCSYWYSFSSWCSIDFSELTFVYRAILAPARAHLKTLTHPKVCKIHPPFSQLASAAL